MVDFLYLFSPYFRDQEYKWIDVGVFLIRNPWKILFNWLFLMIEKSLYHILKNKVLWYCFLFNHLKSFLFFILSFTITIFTIDMKNLMLSFQYTDILEKLRVKHKIWQTEVHTHYAVHTFRSYPARYLLPLYVNK